MNWFKETWWMIKQLFTKVKADKVEYKHMDHYPFSGYSAMSWCGYLLSRKPESQIKPTTWNHEIFISMKLKIKEMDKLLLVLCVGMD